MGGKSPPTSTSVCYVLTSFFLLKAETLSAPHFLPWRPFLGSHAKPALNWCRERASRGQKITTALSGCTSSLQSEQVGLTASIGGRNTTEALFISLGGKTRDKEQNHKVYMKPFIKLRKFYFQAFKLSQVVAELPAVVSRVVVF